MKKAYSTLEIKSTSKADDGKRIFTGIASTPTPDMVQDIVEPNGAEFKLPLPLLWQHNHGDPIGWITDAKVSKSGIEISGEVADIPEKGELKDRLLKAWQMLKNGLVRGLSIGFSPIEYSWMEDTGGMHILKWDWLELSAVTIPANQEATITNIKAASGRKYIPGVAGKRGQNKMNLYEQLKALQDARELNVARMTELSEIIKSADGASSDELDEFDILTGEIERADNDIRLKKAEIVMAGTAKAVKPSVKTSPTILAKKQDPDDKFAGQAYTRFVIAKALAHLDGVSPIVIAERRWGKSNPMLTSFIKAAVEGGGAGSGEWGAELVAADARYTGDFIEYLHGMTVFDRLGLKEIPANVQIKGQDGAATGYWVGESKSIPVSAQSFSAVNLTPLKVGALAVVSNELLRDSTPAAEALVRDALVEASSQKVDTTFLSADAASAGVSPAGILNGVSADSTSGNDADGLLEDIKALYADFITAKNASGLKFVMNPALAKSISLMRNTLGQKEFPELTQLGGMLEGDDVVTGDNVNSSHLILLKPSDIYRIGDMGVQVSISREAMIAMDSAPAGDSQTPTGETAAMVSMFQSESTAIKIVRQINYALRRSGVVCYVDDAAYGTTAST